MKNSVELLLLISAFIILFKLWTSSIFFKNFRVFNEWNQHITNFIFSPLEFYEIVKEIIEEKKIAGVYISIIKLKESGIFSPRRYYLKIQKRDSVFLICSIQFGRDFYITWREGTTNAEFENSQAGHRLYQIDSQKAFEATIQKSIKLALSIVQQSQGFRQNQLQ